MGNKLIVCVESLLANRGAVYNFHSDHLAGGLVQQGFIFRGEYLPLDSRCGGQINAIG